MERKTVMATAVLALLLGSGTAGVAIVKPALDKREALRLEQNRLSGDKNRLQGEVKQLSEQLHGMAMSSIAYFDVSRDPDPPRTVEAKTVETLKSLTEIFNDHHIKVQSLEPKGETTGANKPIPTPKPSPSQGFTDAVAGAVGLGATPSPAADPNAVPTPPLISLVHKVFKLEVEGEYPDLVKALGEIQGLPKAISINEYKLQLVSATKAPDGASGDASPAPGAPSSLLGLEFQMSITFLLSRPDMAPLPDPAASPAKVGAAWWSGLAEWWCPPAAAAEAPRPTPRPWRQLWGGPRPASRSLLKVSPRPRPPVASHPPQVPRAVAPPAPRAVARPAALRPTAARPRALRAASAARAVVLPRRVAAAPLLPPSRRALASRPPGPALPVGSLEGFHVLGRDGEVLHLAVDPARIRQLPVADVGMGLLGVRSEAGRGGWRIVHLDLAPGQKVRAYVLEGRLVVVPLGRPPAAITVGLPPLSHRPSPAGLAPSQVADPAAEWARAFGASPRPPLATPSPSRAPGRERQPEGWEGTQDEGRRLLEERVSPSPEGAEPLLAATLAQPTRLRVVEAGHPRLPGARLLGVSWVAGELRLATQGPRPRIWLQERGALVTRVCVEGIEQSPKGSTHSLGVGGLRQVRVLGPGPLPGTRLVEIHHEPGVRLQLHPGSPGLVRLGVLRQQPAPLAADLTPGLGAAVLPDRLPRTLASPPVAPQAKAPVRPAAVRPRPRPRPLALPSPPPALPAGLRLVASPGPMATPTPFNPTRHLGQPPASSYTFPISRDHLTGRTNPFRSLHQAVPGAPTAGQPLPGQPGAEGLPILPPIPGLPGPGAPASGGTSPASGEVQPTYELTAVLVGGGAPPLAVIMVGDQAFQVRLNDLLPGNARVKQILQDQVVLSLGGQDLRLALRK